MPCHNPYHPCGACVPDSRFTSLKDNVEPREIVSGQTAHQLAQELGIASLPTRHVMMVNQLIVVESSSSSTLKLRDGELDLFRCVDEQSLSGIMILNSFPCFLYILTVHQLS